MAVHIRQWCLGAMWVRALSVPTPVLTSEAGLHAALFGPLLPKVAGRPWVTSKDFLWFLSPPLFLQAYMLYELMVVMFVYPVVAHW